MLHSTIVVLCLTKGAFLSAFCICKFILGKLWVSIAYLFTGYTFQSPVFVSSTPATNKHQNSSNRNTICAYICQIMVAVIILQSIKLLALNQELIEQSGNYYFYLLSKLIHLCVFWRVLHLIKIGKHAHARGLLIFAFCSYLTAACILWQFDVNLQYYFLLALFITMYLIDSEESGLLSLCMIYQLLAFIGFTLLLPKLTIQQEGLIKIAQINTLTFAGSCCICALFIRAILSRNWQQLRNYEARQAQLINSVFPHNMATQLLNEPKNKSPRHLSQHKEMAILFLDICGFTSGLLQNKESSWQNTYSLFAELDKITGHLDTTRVKTNGDQYILVIGMQNSSLSADEIAQQAIEASITITNYCQNKAFVAVRQGLSMGKVIYGIFDTNNPVFDIWGKTVVKAARLEAIAHPNTILVDKTLFQLTQNQYFFSLPITLELKGLGQCDIYAIKWNKNK